MRALPDAHVGKHIFEECVVGALKDKARLFVTNQNHFLPAATRVVVLKGGKISHQGTYDELVAQGVDFASLVEEKKPAPVPGLREIVEDDSIADTSTTSTAGLLQATTVPAVKAAVKVPLAAAVSEKDLLAKDGKPAPSKGKLIETEERETGVVDGRVYIAYFLASGGALFMSLCVTLHTRAARSSQTVR